ncbi:hypothetical protein FNV43_RR00687 [Rhamnella rubrinervis]|uniref:cytokinin riboside 5'-monophosphate phosphoribohydrolase n=1 Tax=Rhamnella rubrinervis TaxID=2594499 RepID=A0A8K0HR53_9ROSA|nr:hypothetical protein FNV43_RR00687 [Rhamnella rubrinervis]
MRLIYGKPCHLPVELKYKAYWVIKVFNSNLDDACKLRKLQISELEELRNDAYENLKIQKDEQQRCSLGNLTLKDFVCQFIRKLDGKHILESLKAFKPLLDVKPEKDVEMEGASVCRFTNICVFRGSSLVKDREFLKAAHTLSRVFAEKKDLFSLLNVNNFFDGLLTFLDHAVEHNFISHSARQILVSVSTADELIDKLRRFVHEPDPVMAKLDWSERGSKKRRFDLTLSL